VELKFLFITESKNLNDDRFKDIWMYFDKPFFINLKYDIKEPVKKKIKFDNYKDVFTLLKKGLIIQGDNNLLITIYYRPYGTIEWRLNFESSDFDEYEKKIIFDFIFLIHRICKLIYGRGTNEVEFNYKHLEQKTYEGIGSSVGWEGCSFWDFYDFLPGIYWLNIFSERLANSLEVKIFDYVHYISNDYQLTIFHMKDELVNEQLSDRLKIESEIVKELGKNYFFDITHKNNQKRHPDIFKSYLENLKS